jgi:anti-anti-sigma factor
MFSVDLSVSERDGETVVTLRGELDVADAASVAAALSAAAEGARTVIVDLAGLQFIDSSGVAVTRMASAFSPEVGAGEAAISASQPGGGARAGFLPAT